MNRQAVVQSQEKITPPVQGGVPQRRCACGQHAGGGECEECRKKQQSLRRKEGNRAGPVGVPPIVHEVLRSSGTPLEPATRAFMEPFFGHDFSRVRVHTDARAAESARAVNALAYTVGPSVVFADGQYRPRTAAGRRLLAHELTHVVQQGAPDDVGAKLQIGQVGDLHEHEADRFANAVSEASSYAPATTEATTILHPAETSKSEASAPLGDFHPVSAARLQRQPGGDAGGGCHTGPEAGAVGSLEFCVDFCSGDWRISGWVWVGAGYRTAVGCTFVGPSVMYEDTLLALGNSPSLQLINCGRCAEDCIESEGLSGGLAGFPNIFSPSAGRQVLSLAGLECGILFIASSRCRGALEGICFLDLIRYLGPIGRAITTMAERLSLEVKAGIDGGVTIEVCRGENGGIVAPRAEVCLGGFIEVGRGLSKNKADHQ